MPDKGLLFTYALTYGGAFVSLFNPFVGLLVYICFAIVRPDSMWHWAVSRDGNYSRIVAGGLLVGWILNGCGRWQFGRARGIVLALLAFWLWTVLSTVGAASDKTVAWNAIEAESKIFLPVLVGMTIIDSVQRLKQLAWVIILSQGYVAYELNLSYFSGWNRLTEEGFGGMDNNCVGIALVSCAGPAFFLGLHASRWWWKGLALAAAALMVHAVLFSFSRGAMMALIVVAVFSFLLLRKKPVHYVIFILAVLVGLRLAGPEVRARFLTSFAAEEERDSSAQSRVQLWTDLLSVMRTRPVFGAGPNHWPLIADTYGWPAGKHGHCLWLQIGAELGFPGLVFLLSYFGLCVIQLWPLVGQRCALGDPWLHAAAAMVIASLVGYIVAAQFVTVPGLEVPYYIVLVGASTLKLSSLTPPASAVDSLSEDEPAFAEG